MQKITTCLWFNGRGEEAANFYTGLFEDSKVTDIVRNTGTAPGPAGNALTVAFTLGGQPFVALNGGDQYQFTPAISFFVSCDSEKEIDTLYKKLSDGGVLMPLQKYPFSERYGWVTDRYGLSWQLNLAAGTQKIAPFLMFTGAQQGKAEEALHFYQSVFNSSGTEHITRYGPGEQGTEGTVIHATFTLEGQQFMALDSNLEHAFTFNEAVSFVVNCETQQQVDDYWEKLSAGGSQVACGWLKDKYGVSWQVVPLILPKLLLDQNRGKADRVMSAMMKMVKLDIATLQQA
jgi:predicted 3-demethylubiquinone-9 3-methyltransferase (glyoxalase superfamily)